MINFRYHIVSLVAIFLALGVGLILGANVLDQGLVSQLRSDARRFADRNSQLRSDNESQAKQIAFWEKFGATIVPGLVRSKLAGHEAVLLVQTGADSATLTGIETVLKQAGVTKPARITFSDRWNLTDEQSRTSLAKAVSAATTADAKTLVATAGPALGARLVASQDSQADTDLLRVLSNTGFLRLDGAAKGSFPAAGALIIVVPSGVANAAPSQADFFVPLIKAMAGKRMLGVAEARSVKESLSDRVRGDGTLAPFVSTVDHADTTPGELSLVWGMRALLDGKRALHYGLHGGTDGVAPAEIV